MSTQDSAKDLFADALAKVGASATPAATAAAEQAAAGPSQEEQDKARHLELLKQRAKLMGITHSPNIGIEALRAKIKEKEEADETATTADTTETQQSDPAAASQIPSPGSSDAALAADKPVRERTLRQVIREREMRLVRLRITNLDPKKKDLPGEIITVANEYLGTVRKFIPFGEVTDDGYHVPYCLYKILRDREFLHISTSKKDRRTGVPVVEKKMVREFALEILEPLTPAELERLKQAQIAAGSIG